MRIVLIGGKNIVSIKESVMQTGIQQGDNPLDAGLFYASVRRRLFGNRYAPAASRHIHKQASDSKPGKEGGYLTLCIRAKRLGIAAVALVVCAAVTLCGCLLYGALAEEGEENSFIKWVDFNVPYEMLDKALALDVESHEKSEDTPLNWIELLAYTAARCGGNWSGVKTSKLDELAALLRQGQTLEELTASMKYYDYYLEAYTAVLGGMVGSYEVQVQAEGSEELRWESRYGLMAFSPIAKNYPYSDYDDFGSSRDYGYKRKHLGHDLMGATGTPIIAVEGGVVEALGWNQYGGWRIGIRSFDGKRYYYYAHLRQNFPYNKSLREGSVVWPGDVIGYLGHTGYSANENVNNIQQPHLHFGIQLIFDESQKEGNNEIWIDCYNLVRLLRRHQSEVVKNQETKEYSRIYDIRIPDIPARYNPTDQPDPLASEEQETAPESQPAG